MPEGGGGEEEQEETSCDFSFSFALSFFFTFTAARELTKEATLSNCKKKKLKKKTKLVEQFFFSEPKITKTLTSSL